MPKILSIIPMQQFELVRDLLGGILADELPNQFSLSGEDALNATVWLERFVPFGPTEYPGIIVTMGRGDYGNKHRGQVDGTYVYYIDCYTASPTTIQYDGDRLATINLHRLIGVIRAILENPIYETLGFARPFNCSVEVSSIAIADPENKQDTVSEIQARLEVTVRIPETTTSVSGLPLALNTTTVQLELTEKGYQYIYSVGGITTEDDQEILTEGNQNIIIE